MAFRSIASSRGAWAGLAFAGMVAGTAGGAAAQYIDDYGGGYSRGYGYGYGYDYDDGRRDGYRELSPPRMVSRVAVRDFGMSRIERTVRTGSSYVVDGVAADGARLRLIFDARTGAFLDRIVLQRPERQPAPRIARVDPRDDDRPAPRIVPRPPERPASLKPPAQASAPATVIPAVPAAPPAPTPGPTNPASGQPKPELAKPGLVNPQDVRGTGEPERTPPLARAEPPSISIPPIEIPPVQIEDIAPPRPGPETPAVPAAPLE